MVSDDKGEWKLLKVWQCKKCKLLIRDARQVFDHNCGVDDKEHELSKLRNIIEERNKTIEEFNIVIEQQNHKVQGLENFVKELNAIIAKGNNTISDIERTVEEQKNIIDENKRIIDSQKKAIIEHDITIETLKKNQNKIVEKVVYVNSGTDNNDSTGNIGKDEDVQNISVDIWQKHFRVKDSKDNGYREDIEFEIFERGRGKEKIIIKNGKVLKKPDDIIVIGKYEREGFTIKGIYRN